MTADMATEPGHTSTPIPDHELGLFLHRARGGRPSTADLGGQLGPQQWDRNIHDLATEGLL